MISIGKFVKEMAFETDCKSLKEVNDFDMWVLDGARLGLFQARELGEQLQALSGNQGCERSASKMSA